MTAFEWQSFFVTPLTNGFLFALLIFGVFVAFRVLDIADLSVEGLFPLVTLFSLWLIEQGVSPLLVVLIGCAIGVISGILNATLTLYLKIPALLSGIIMMSAMFAIGIIIVSLAGGTIALASDRQTIYTGLASLLKGWGINTYWSTSLSKIIIAGAVDGLCFFGLYYFFGTELGMSIRAAGKNAAMSRSQGISTQRMFIIGAAISGLLVALSAALYAQSFRSATPQDGQGMIVLGLSGLFLGEAIIGRRSFKNSLFSVFVGAFIYWFIMQILVEIFPNSSLYLWKALLLAIVLAIPYLCRLVRGKIEAKKKVGEEINHA